jgi:DNA-binding protein H-NS
LPAQRLELEVEGQTGGLWREEPRERLAQRNGYSDRIWETRAGTVELRIPKLCKDSYFPSFLEHRRMADKALTAMVQGGATSSPMHTLMSAKFSRVNPQCDRLSSAGPGCVEWECISKIRGFVLGGIRFWRYCLIFKVIIASRQKTLNGRWGRISGKRFELKSISLDDLWSLHEQLGAILSARIRAEKNELEKRLAILNRGMDVIGECDIQLAKATRRRRYPRVSPKYRNPLTVETWSGRGKCPRWLVAVVKSGHQIEEFRIEEGGHTELRQRA